MKYLLFAIVLTLSFSCTRQNSKPIQANAGDCENAVIIDTEKYKNTSPNVFNITSCIIKADCLEITINAGGCDGSAWKADLISNGSIAESFPPQKFLKILFTNPEFCMAVPSRKFSYNLRPLRVSGTNKVLFNLQGWDQELVYQY